MPSPRVLPARRAPADGATFASRSARSPQSRHFCSGRGPSVVASEWQAESVVVNAEISIPATLDRIGPHHADLLRHHADIGFGAAVIGEAVVAQPVLQMPQQHDVVLERDVRTASTATPAAAAESTAPAAAESAASTATKCTAATAECNAVSATGKSP